MTIEQLEKQQELLKELKNGLNTQHEILMDLLGSLNTYADWLLEQVKEIRDNG